MPRQVCVAPGPRSGRRALARRGVGEGGVCPRRSAGIPGFPVRPLCIFVAWERNPVYRPGLEGVAGAGWLWSGGMDPATQRGGFLHRTTFLRRLGCGNSFRHGPPGPLHLSRATRTSGEKSCASRPSKGRRSARGVLVTIAGSEVAGNGRHKPSPSRAGCQRMLPQWDGPDRRSDHFEDGLSSSPAGPACLKGVRRASVIVRKLSRRRLN